MKLTNNMRDSFVTAVMADVPHVDFETRIRDAVNMAHAAALPAPVKKMLADEDLREYLGERYASIARVDGAPPGVHISFRLSAPSDDWLEDLVANASRDLIKQWAAQEETHISLSQKLRAVARTSTTVKQLRDAFPEFAKYMPADEAEACRTLPAVANVVADFVKAGWPKGARHG